MAHKLVSMMRLGLFAPIFCVLLCMGMHAGKAPDQGFPPGVRQLAEAPPGQQAAVMKTLEVNYRMADVSLAVREQADFLLTPALLVQEAISDGVVLTYPEE